MPQRTTPPGRARGPRALPYARPTRGRDYWIVDEALPAAHAVRQRCLDERTWIPGFPHAREAWPGMRTPNALLADELAVIEQHVRRATGAEALRVARAADGTTLNHNCVQRVQATEGRAKPHTDSRDLCRYAAVLYLTPGAPAGAGTTFYRQHLGHGALGGNTVPPKYRNLAEAMAGVHLPADSFVPDLAIENRFNRLLLYRANLIHSATGYAGLDATSARMTALFFWQA